MKEYDLSIYRVQSVIIITGFFLIVDPINTFLITKIFV